MKAWVAARWAALAATGGVLPFAAFLTTAVMSMAPLTWEGLVKGLTWFALAAYYCEWQHADYRYKQHEHYIKLGQSVQHRIDTARKRGHDNILITF